MEAGADADVDAVGEGARAVADEAGGIMWWGVIWRRSWERGGACGGGSRWRRWEYWDECGEEVVEWNGGFSGWDFVKVREEVV